MAPIRLRHIHLPASPADGIYPSYKTAVALQELLRRRLLDFKDAEATSSRPPTSPPHPTLITFTPQPTYTLGRRQAQTASLPSSSSSPPRVSPASSLSPAEIARLKAPLRIRSSEPKTLPGLGVVPPRRTSDEEDDDDASTRSGPPSPPATTHHPPGREHVFHPSVLTSPRGGLATYHGPGQVVLWPVMVISSPPSSPAPLGYRAFSVRCYSRLLEDTTTALLRRLFGLQGFTTDDPGVWVRTPGLGGGVRKISALGIHLRRHVSSLGAAINLDMPTTTAAATKGAAGSGAAEEEGPSNPWARFVACGLEGKGVTCVAEELRAAGGSGIPGLDAEIVARAWAEELARGMGLGGDAQDGGGGGVERVGADEVEEMVATAEEDGFLEAVGRDEV